nr:putative arylsulfatase [uncultured bacterium]
MKREISVRTGSLVIALLCLSLLLSTTPSAIAAGADKPNIVIMVMDDLGYADPGFRGSGIDTPAIDRLASEGMALERFYVAPICSPTRAALMTGRNPMRLGVGYSVILPWDSGGVHTDETFMSESFRRAGYQTALVGKWHLGHSQQNLHPNARGFEDFYGHLHTEVGYYPPFANLGGKDFQLNGQSIEEEGYESFLLASYASNWIAGRDKNKPFFLYLPFLAPHEPLAAPEELVEKYKDMPDKRKPARSPSDEMSRIIKLSGQKTRRPLFAATVEAMDMAIAQVLEALDREGIADNTIVMLFSDNGATRVHGRGGGDNAPFRGGKAEVYEGGIRVASFVRWPGRVEAGSASQDMMTVMDVFPTLMKATKIKPGDHFEFDGINVLDQWVKQKKVRRRDVQFFASEIPRYGSFGLTAFDEQWKLIQWVEQDQLSTTVTSELFNILEDPGEYNNLAQEHPDIVNRLAAEIRNWRQRYPINGTRARIASPPGWHAPKDWADYPRPSSELQERPATNMAPNSRSERMLDAALGERGRLIYNCEPKRWMAGVCVKQ